MKLFALRYLPTGKLLPQTFPNKAAAKLERDRLNAASGSITHVVTYGPDHRHQSK